MKENLKYILEYLLYWIYGAITVIIFVTFNSKSPEKTDLNQYQGQFTLSNEFNDDYVNNLVSSTFHKDYIYPVPTLLTDEEIEKERKMYESWSWNSYNRHVYMTYYSIPS